MNWLVCYDIEDDKTRVKIARLLERWGSRVQFSVFEVNIYSDNELIKLRRQLTKVLNGEDGVRLYRTCERCRGVSHSVHGERLPEDPYAFVL